MKELKEENWAYFRPGYYPLEEDSIVPAMVCLGDKLYNNSEPNIQFVLVKTDCYLKAWQDALLVSEKDFDLITKQPEMPSDDATKKAEYLIEKFIKKGYLPLTQIKTEVKFNEVH